MRNYGLRAFDIATQAEADMGQWFGKTLSAREVDYLIDNEWARSAQDVLWRRSKLGLFMTDAEKGALQTYIEERTGTERPAGSETSGTWRQDVA